MPKLKKTAGGFAKLIDAIGKKKVAVYTGASVYFIFMALVPITMLLVSLIRYLPFSADDVLRIFADTVPQSLYSVIKNIVRSIYNSGSGVITVSILLTLFSASGAMRSLMKGLDAAYGVERKEHVAIFFGRGILYMLVFVVMVILSLGIMVYGGDLLGLLRSKLPESDFVNSLFSMSKYMRYLLVMALLTLFFLILYRYVPAGTRHMKDQWPGALFASVAWVAFSWLYSIYNGISNRFGAYGYLGTIMVAMMWMYYCLQFLLIGGVINSHLQSKRDEAAP